MNHGGAQRECKQEPRRGKVRAAPQAQTQSQSEGQRNDHRGEENHSVQPHPMMSAGDHQVIEPFPGIPGLSNHGDGERIRARNGVGAQHVLAIADMPPDSGIAQQTRR